MVLDISKNIYLIFDLDGAVTDMKKYHQEAHNKVLEKYNISLTDNDFIRYEIYSDEQIYKMISREFHIKLDAKELVQEKTEFLTELIEASDIKPYSEVKEIVEKHKNIKYLLTDLEGNIAHRLLKKLGLSDKFEVVVSIKGLNKSKIQIIKELKIPLENIILFENNCSFIIEARNNKISTISIIDKYNQDRLKDELVCIEVNN